VDLTKEEVITVAMAADLNGDGEVDFEEFMKHFPTVLDMIQFNKYLKEKFAQVLEEEKRKANPLGLGEDELDGEQIGDLQMS